MPVTPSLPKSVVAHTEFCHLLAELEVEALLFGQVTHPEDVKRHYSALEGARRELFLWVEAHTPSPAPIYRTTKRF